MPDLLLNAETLDDGEAKVQVEPVSNLVAGQTNLRDLTIIGGGPAGIFAAFQCGMNDITCRIIDSISEVGGQLIALYPEKYIYDVAGFPKVTAADLVAKLWEQALPFSPEVILREQAVQIEKQPGDTFIVTTGNGNRYASRAVLIAAGLGAFSPRKLDQLKNAPPLEDRCIFYAVRSKEDFRGCRVVIVGGGDSALDWTMGLFDVAAHITLVHRMTGFNGHAKTVADVMGLHREKKIDLYLQSEITAIDVDEGGLRRVHVLSKPDNYVIDAERLLPLVGFKSDLGPIKLWGLKLEGNGIAVDMSTMATSTEGVYAAGDIAAYPGKLKLIQTGLSDAAVAVRSSLTYIKPGEKIKHQFSSIRMAEKKTSQ